MKTEITLNLINEAPKHRHVLPINVNLITQYELESMGWYEIDYLLEEAPLLVLKTHKWLKMDIMPLSNTDFMTITHLGTISTKIALEPNELYNFTPTQLEINLTGVDYAFFITENQKEEVGVGWFERKFEGFLVVPKFKCICKN